MPLWCSVQRMLEGARSLAPRPPRNARGSKSVYALYIHASSPRPPTLLARQDENYPVGPPQRAFTLRALSSREVLCPSPIFWPPPPPRGHRPRGIQPHHQSPNKASPLTVPCRSFSLPSGPQEVPPARRGWSHLLYRRKAALPVTMGAPEWVIGVILNLLGSIIINLGTNLMKLGHTKAEKRKKAEASFCPCVAE
jgi:hypothetical protein